MSGHYKCHVPAKILTSLRDRAQRCPDPHLCGGSLVISPCYGPCLVSVVNQKSFSIQRLLGSNILSIFMNAFFVYLDANELGARQPFLGKWDPKTECRVVYNNAKPAAALLREHFERNRSTKQVASTACYNKYNDT